MTAKKPKSSEDEPESESRLDLAYWPKLPIESRGREAIFKFLHTEDEKALIALGYAPLLLRKLPLGSSEEVHTYNRCVLRGMIDGTIWLSAEQQKALELDMRHRRMLDTKEPFEEPKKKRTETVDEMLAWDDSRHTATNTTIVSAAEMNDFALWKRERLEKGKVNEQLRPDEDAFGARQLQQLSKPKRPRRKRKPNAG